MAFSLLRRRMNVIFVIAALLSATHLKADDVPSLAGTYSDGKLTVDFTASGANYAGKLSMGGQEYPAKATVNGQGLSGTFTAAKQDFPFTATLSGGQLTFITGGKTYTLTRNVSDYSAVGGAVAGPATIGDFAVLGQTASGKALFLKLASAPTVEAAITQTADAIGKISDAKPNVTGAFADSQNKLRGGASFTARQNGKDVHGIIFCTAIQGNAPSSATAVYEAVDAPKTDMATLMAFLPAESQMQTHTFPDGSGSVDLPPGWKTSYTSATHGIGITGPSGQFIIINISLAVNDPNCSLVRLSQQNYQLSLRNYNTQLQNYQRIEGYRRNNPNVPAMTPPQKPTPPDPDPNVQFPNLYFCRECRGPADVFQYWSPIAQEKSKRANRDYQTIDRVIESINTGGNPMMAGSESGIVYVATTQHHGDKLIPYREITRITTAPIKSGEVWQLSASTMRGPSVTFDGDLPLMNAIMGSFKLNMDVVNKQFADENQAIRQMGEANTKAIIQRGQAFREQQQDNFNRFESTMAAQEKARHDSASDFIEYIGGVRDVYDTKTGQMSSVDLFHSNGIVEGLNEATNDPNRFVQIPLRYER